MKDDDDASGSSECVLTKPVKLLNSLHMKTAGFFGSANYQQLLAHPLKDLACLCAVFLYQLMEINF